MGVKPAISLGFRAAEVPTYTATYTETHTETKMLLRTGRANCVLRAAAALARPDRAAGALHTTGIDIVEPLARLNDQQQMNAFTREPVVMIESFRVDQCDVRLTVLGDDLFGAGFELLNQFRESGANLRAGN
jgi:hypothetical protein